MIREDYFKDHPLEKNIFTSVVISTPADLKDEITLAHQDLKKMNHTFFSEVIKNTKLRNGVKHDDIMRYLESIAALYRPILERYSNGSLDIEKMIEYTNDIIDFVLFGVIER